MKSQYSQVKDFFLIGKTLKSHGTDGQMRLMVEDRLKRYLQKKNVFVFLDMDGSKVPFQITAVQDSQHFVIRLKDVDSKEASNILAGKELWLPTELVEPRHQRSPRSLKEKWEDYSILDETTSRSFFILRTEEYPQQLMAVVECNEKEILIPLHEDLISEIDKEQKVIHMQIPDGLLDL